MQEGLHHGFANGTCARDADLASCTGKASTQWSVSERRSVCLPMFVPDTGRAGVPPAGSLVRCVAEVYVFTELRVGTAGGRRYAEMSMRQGLSQGPGHAHCIPVDDPEAPVRRISSAEGPRRLFVV